MPSPGENYVTGLEVLRRRFDRYDYANLGESAAEAAWKQIILPAYKLMGSDYARAIIDGWSATK